MLVWPQASVSVGGTTVLKPGYIAATAVALLLSFFMLWYTEKPAVREGLLRG